VSADGRFARSASTQQGHLSIIWQQGYAFWPRQAALSAHGDPNQHGHQQGRQSLKGGTFPYAIAITTNRTTAYVVNRAAGTVTPIRTATITTLHAINVGSRPGAIAITP